MSEPTVTPPAEVTPEAPSAVLDGWEHLDRAGQRAVLTAAVQRTETAEARVAELEAQLRRARAAAQDLLALMGPAPA